jgi:hypothetical protein
MKIIIAIWLLMLMYPVGVRSFGSNELDSYDDYLMTMELFCRHGNKWIQPGDVKNISSVNWALADGNFGLARRIAAKESAECNFRVLAFLPDGTPTKGVPRADLLGGHYNLLAREAHRLKLIQYPTDWYYSDEFDAFKKVCWANPAYGTWILGQAYVRMVKKIGMDRADHWWQSGRSYFNSRQEYLTETTKKGRYLKVIHDKEKQFDRYQRMAEGMAN